MSDVEFSDDEIDLLHPIVESNQEIFDKLVDITERINEINAQLKQLKIEKAEIEGEIVDIIRELPADEQNDDFEYKSIKIKFTTKTKLQVGNKRRGRN